MVALLTPARLGHRVHAHRAESAEQQQLGGRLEDRAARLLAARPPAPGAAVAVLPSTVVAYRAGERRLARRGRGGARRARTWYRAAMSRSP